MTVEDILVYLQSGIDTAEDMAQDRFLVAKDMQEGDEKARVIRYAQDYSLTAKVLRSALLNIKNNCI
jgi:hypothetical protein